MGMNNKNGFSATRMAVDPEAYLIIDGRLHLFLNSPNRNYKEVFEKSESQANILKNAEKFWKSREDLAALHSGLPEGLNPKARMELLQWQVFMGEWEVYLKWWADTTGVNVTQSRGKWSIYYGFMGYCIQDDFSPQNNSPFSGTAFGPTIRGYDPSGDEWHMTYIPVNQPRSATWMITANFLRPGYLEGTMETKDSFGRPVIQKIIFDLQSPDKFIWRGHWSWDNGKTWKENVGLGVSTRKK